MSNELESLKRTNTPNVGRNIVQKIICSLITVSRRQNDIEDPEHGRNYKQVSFTIEATDINKTNKNYITHS